jgi:tRNA(Arg) A34 adenosine deaminase TadA
MADVEPRAAMTRALELAEESVERGDEPFGSVLVFGDTIIAEEHNTVRTDDDRTAHPELKLVRWAGRNLSAEERRRTTMYTSTEPCPMCSGGIRNVGLGRVVYSASAEVVSIVAGSGDTGPRCAAIVGDDTDVEGPLLPERGRAVHEDFW